MRVAAPAALLVLVLTTTSVLAACGDGTGAPPGSAGPGQATTGPPSLPTPPVAADGATVPSAPEGTTTLSPPGTDPPRRRPPVSAVQRPADPVRCPAADGSGKGGSAGASGSAGFDARELLGLGLDAAKARAEEHGCVVRVVNRDGQELARTLDLSNARINVVETKGRVVALTGIG